MKTSKRIDCETERIKFGYFDEEKQKWIDLDSIEEIEKFAKRKDFRTELGNALNGLTEMIIECVGTDLRDIWKRLDQLER